MTKMSCPEENAYVTKLGNSQRQYPNIFSPWDSFPYIWRTENLMGKSIWIIYLEAWLADQNGF